MKSLKSLFNPELKLTKEEQVIQDIFVKLLDSPKTNKVLVNSECSYLSNPSLGISAVIDNDCVIIEYQDLIINVKCRYKFLYLLESKVNDSVNRSVKDIYARMFGQQMNALNMIDDEITKLTVEK